MVYVLNKEGLALMPTKRHGKVRRMLRDGQAKVINRKPFTIQLCYETTNYTQEIKLGVDSGYLNIGFSAITEKEELIATEVKTLKGMSERLKERRMYRTQRRSKLRYRKPRFDNRGIPKGWFAPSINHKLATHISLIDKLKKILPVTETIVVVAAFDIQKIKNPGISGEQYQQGEQLDYWNIREYVLHRDGHKCRNPNCKNKSKEIILEVHHLGYWKGDRSDRPGNLITLCTKCHDPKNHKEKGFLYGWQPEVKSFKDATFMSTVRWQLVNRLGCKHSYGFITKNKRIELGLEKSHANDAFVIAGGTDQKRSTPYPMEQIKRNNRSLTKFYDAKYIDIRNKKKVSGQDLNCGRRTRNKNHNSENLRKYRGQKVSKGRYSIRKQRYFYQPGDLVKMEDKIYTVKGTHNKGARIILKENNKSFQVDKLSPYQFRKGLCYV